jgi:FkbM family methyltransferase
VSRALHKPTRPGFSRRLRCFLGKPWPEKIRTVGLYARKMFPNLPIPVRLPFGSWFLAWQNDLGNHILAGDYEEPEYAFVQRFLKQGMVVLDIGANEGSYTLLASKCVGAQGLVIGFEPSPRERRRLRFNLWMNRCKNVQVEEIALGAAEGQVDLHVVEKGETGCNSLRPPVVKSTTRTVRVRVRTLDQFLRHNAIQRVDFVKMDIEGAELSALQGAATLLQSLLRPFLLIEVFEIRARPWGYFARDVVKLLCETGYLLYRPSENEGLEAADASQDLFDTNLVAVPMEKVAEISCFLPAQEAPSCLQSD